MLIGRILLLLLPLCAGLPALEVLQVRWGFDGGVLPERFAPLAVLVANPGPEPFEGAVQLRAGSAVAREGVPWVQPCYLAPGSARWLLFAPWVSRHAGEFTLSWPGGSASAGEPRSTQVPGIAILAADPRSAGDGFPEAVFPATASLTDGLGRLITDHAPRWSPEQRQACLTWVRRGGELHLAQGRDGRLPALPPELAGLERDPGLGRLVRHDQEARQVQALLTPAAKAEAPAGGHAQGAIEAIQRAFGNAVQANPAWGVIISVLVLFLLLTGPGMWWLARRRSWWQVHAAVLVLVAVATVLIAWVGRRGYGEQASTRLAVYALDDGASWDASWFATSFVTASRTLSLRPPVEGRALLGCPGSWESCEGAVVEADGGRLETAVPLFSARHWAGRGALAAPLPPPRVQVDAAGGGLVAVRVALPAAWPAVHAVHLLHAGKVHALTRDGEGWHLAPRAPALDPDDLAVDHGYGTQAKPLAGAGAALLAYAADPARGPGPGRAAVLVTADLPARLHLAEGGVGGQEGRLVLRHDLRIGEP